MFGMPYYQTIHTMFAVDCMQSDILNSRLMICYDRLLFFAYSLILIGSMHSVHLDGLNAENTFHSSLYSV